MRDDGCMLPRRLPTILQQPPHLRFRSLSEGARMLAESVATLEADAVSLGSTRRDRGAAVLRCFIEEEAAKVLILLDLARAGWANQSAVSKCLRAFYSHLARGLYVKAYDGSPDDLAEIRNYVDHLRQEFYLDGPMDVDWIFGNEVIASREGRLYVDYVEDEHGERRWTGPADRSALMDEPFDFPAPASAAVPLVSALSRIGLLEEQGFDLTREVWDGVVVDDRLRWLEIRKINVEIVNRVAQHSGLKVDVEADREAARFVVEHWIHPLFSLDLALAKVDPQDLKQERERWLAEQVDI